MFLKENKIRPLSDGNSGRVVVVVCTGLRWVTNLAADCLTTSGGQECKQDDGVVMVMLRMRMKEKKVKVDTMVQKERKKDNTETKWYKRVKIITNETG